MKNSKYFPLYFFSFGKNKVKLEENIENKFKRKKLKTLVFPFLNSLFSPNLDLFVFDVSSDHLYPAK